MARAGLLLLSAALVSCTSAPPAGLGEPAIIGTFVNSPAMERYVRTWGIRGSGGLQDGPATVAGIECGNGAGIPTDLWNDLALPDEALVCLVRLRGRFRSATTKPTQWWDEGYLVFDSPTGTLLRQGCCPNPRPRPRPTVAPAR